MKSKLKKILAASLLVVHFSFPLSATDYTWDGGDTTTDNWDSPNNWLGDTTFPVGPDTAIFSSAAGAVGGTVNANGPQVCATMVVSELNWEFVGPDLTVTNVNIAGGDSTFRNFFASGTINASGDSNLTFDAGNNIITALDYTGTGTVVVNGSLSGPVTINNPNATLRGTSTIGGNVTMISGTISPATSTTIGTFPILGDYTQSAAASYAVQINSLGRSDALDINGTAAITNGTIVLEPLSGSYVSGTEYTILTANEVTGSYTSLIETHPLSFSVRTTSNSVILTINENTTLLPTNQFSGNTQVMKDYMYANNSFVFSNADLTSVSQSITSLPASQFLRSLVKLSGVSIAALPLAQFQNDVRMAVVLDERYRRRVRQNTKKKKICYDIPQTGVFIEPIGVYYNQRATGGSITNAGQIPFSAFSYGAGAGWEKVIAGKFIVEAGVGYTHSNLNWQQHFGNARWSSLYIAPFFGWFNRNAFGNFMIMGSFNFYRTFRQISGVNLERVARSQYTSYDLLLRGNGGARIFMFKNFIFQPEGTLNYLTLFSPSYQEYGAGSINLSVKSRTDQIMQPSIRLRIVKEYQTWKACHSPNLYVGWLANIWLNSDDIRARFLGAPNQTFFKVAGYKKTANQLILGAQYYVQKRDKWILTANFELDMLSQFEIYTLDCKFQLLF